MINSHALWLAIRAFVFYKFPPNIRAHDNYVGEVHIVRLTISTVNRGQQRYFSASKFANGACLLAVQSEHSICAYLWAGPESINFA